MSENDGKKTSYKIDARQSRFTVKAFAEGMLSAFGHNPTLAIRDFEGEAKFAPDAPENSSLRLRIKADSLEVTDDVSDKDRKEIENLMREEVLETDKYSEIVFESAKVSAEKIFEGQYRADISGDLSLHGVTRKVSLQAQVKVNEDRLRAQGDFSMRQTNYNIKLVKAGGGIIKVKDELKFSFDIVASGQ